MPFTHSLLHSAALASFAVLFAAGCAATPVDGGDDEPVADVEATDEGLHASCPNRQAIPLVSPAQNAARYQSFLDRNGPGWKSSLPAWGFDLVTGAVSFSSRDDAMGPALANVTKTDAERVAKAFILNNWDLVGFRSAVTASHAAANATAVDAQYAGGGFAWRVLVEAEESQPGYAHIDGATQRLQFSVDIANDGTIRRFSSVNAHLIPPLTMSAVPKRSVASAKASVVGFPLTYRPGPYENDWGAVYDYGAVTAADLASTELAVEVDHDGTVPPLAPNTRTMRMMHKLTVQRPGVEATFYIDTCSGGRVGEPFIRRTL